MDGGVLLFDRVCLKCDMGWEEEVVREGGRGKCEHWSAKIGTNIRVLME